MRITSNTVKLLISKYPDARVNTRTLSSVLVNVISVLIWRRQGDSPQ